MTSESEDRMMSEDGVNSPTLDEVTVERNMLGNGTLKKGPWTSAEDAILMDYVSKHGEGNWNAVQKHSGLSRCGKSCRLRWANHLRPDLKKGAFTPEEERRVIELHAKMGNKWARMAVELPGRTDNEIKNFWNTRTKRRQRAGLPIYPPEVCLQTVNDATQSQNMVTFANGDTSLAQIIPSHNFQIPAVEFKNLELKHEIYPQTLVDTFLDIPGGPQVLGSTSNNNNDGFGFPTPKRIRRSDAYVLCDGEDVFPMVNLYQDFELSSSYDQNLLPSPSLFTGSHAFLNGNTSSSSEPISWATKLELPSLQYSTQVGSCGAPLPSLESVDALIQSTLIGQTSHRNNGLLEAVLYESQTMKMSKSNNNSNASVLPSSQDDWGDPVSPLGYSSASVFSEYIDEHQSIEVISDDPGGKQYEQEDEDKSNYIRPDFLLGSNWFGSGSNAHHNKLVAPLPGDHLCGDIPASPFYNESSKWDISEICRTSGNH